MSASNDNDQSKRTKRFPDVRASVGELATLKDKAKAAGLSQSNYIRSMCLDGHVIVRENAVDIQAVRQLLAIGNNLNQIARAANIHDDMNPDEREHLTHVLRVVESTALELMK